MTVFGDPNRFAMIIEALPQWTSEGGYSNGIFHFVVDQNIFPPTVRVATLSADICCLGEGNALHDLPENQLISGMPAPQAFYEILRTMRPGYVMDEDDVPDDFISDYTYQASTYNLEEGGCYAFAVADGPRVRILAADVHRSEGSMLENSGSWPDVSEVWIERWELASIIEAVRQEFCNV